ncbi:MAG TPA: hypothetical protein VKW78_00330 [Terriglobales bacterium]|nr:hypothetical protein [Terriglobales bacterium]
MMLILGIIVGIIEKARAVAYANLPVPAIHSTTFVSTQAVIAVLVMTYILGAAAWALVFAMRRSGVHRLSQIETWTHAQR